MDKAVYINGVSTYLPNFPLPMRILRTISGKISGNPSRVRSIVLRQNVIMKRYYGLDKNQNLTLSNAKLAKKAVSVASVLTSPALASKFYDPEYETTHDNPDKDPCMAFEKDFMRFMLSDGAGAVLVQDHPEERAVLVGKQDIR